MRSRLLAAGVVVVGVSSVAPAAHAGDWSWHAVATGFAAWTDNVFSSPSNATAEDNVQPRESDVYYQLQPGTLFTWESPRIIQELSASIDATLYTEHSEARALTYRAGWRSFYVLTPRTELGASGSASTGSLSTFATRGTADTGQPSLLPSTSASFFSLEASQNLAFTISEESSLHQAAFARRFAITDDPVDEDTMETTTHSYAVGGSLGIDRSFKFDAVGAAADVGYIGLEAADSMAEASDMVNLGVTVSWRRDLSRRVSSSLGVGFTEIIPVGGGDARGQPTVSGSLGYFPEWGMAMLSLSRSVTPNLYIAANTVSDTASVNAALPLRWLEGPLHEPHLIVSTSAGVSRTQIVEPSGDLSSSFNVFLADGAISYTPSDALALSLRYQYLRQDATSSVVQDTFDYDRHTAILTLSGRYPTRQASDMPVRNTMRVSDPTLTEVGEGEGDRTAPRFTAP